MSECLKGMKWSEIREMSFDELCNLKCVEIVDENGEPRERFGMFLMVPTTQFIQTQCDFKGGLSNTNWQAPEEPELAPLYVADPKPKHRRKVRAAR